MLCFREVLVAKKFVDKRGGVSRLSAGKFLYHSAENTRRGIFCCFTEFGCQKTLGINRKNNWHDSDSKPQFTASELFCPKPIPVMCF